MEAADLRKAYVGNGHRPFLFYSAVLPEQRK